MLLLLFCLLLLVFVWQCVCVMAPAGHSLLAIRIGNDMESMHHKGRETNMIIQKYMNIYIYMYIYIQGYKTKEKLAKGTASLTEVAGGAIVAGSCWNPSQ